MDKRLFVISLILFVNVLGVGLILPLLPYFAENLGANPLIIGFFLSVYPLCSILAAPFLGVLSDKYGRKSILLFSILGTIIGFLLLGFAKTLSLLFFARIIDGISAGNTSIAKAAIADITTKSERVTKLGLTFAVESLGLILGPVLGGLFSQYGFTVSAYIAALIASICFILTLFFFPETRDTPSPTLEKQSTFDLSKIFKVIKDSKTQFLILVIFTVQLLITIMWGTIALYGKYMFGFSGKEIGYISAFAALVGIFSQIILLRFLTTLLREKSIIILGLLCMSIGLVLISVSNIIGTLLLGIGIMAASFNIAMPTTMGLVSKLSSEDEQGNIMGIMSSFINLGSVIGPILGNLIFTISTRGNYLFACIFGLLVAFISFKKVK